MNALLSEILGNNTTKDKFKTGDVSNQLIGLTNIGLNRAKNQDALSFFLDKKSGELLLSLADGLGSYIHSEKAAFTCVREIPRQIMSGQTIFEASQFWHKTFLKGYPYEKKSLRGKFRQYLKRKMAPHLQHPDQKNLDYGSTTYVMAQINNNQLMLANVGDSRAYVFRQRSLLLQTEDQSLAKLIEFKEKNGETIIDPPKNIKGAILNSLGSPEPYFEFYTPQANFTKLAAGTPIIYNADLMPGDIILLASDGLFSNLSLEELIQIINETPWDEINDKLEKIILRVMRMGWTNMGEKSNPDNFSFIIYRHF